MTNAQTSPQPQPAAKTNDDIAALEAKFLHPQGINQRFDLLVDKIRTVPAAEKIFFTQNLGVMIKSGLSLARALRTLTLQTANVKFKRVLLKVFRSVERGVTLAESLEPFEKTFSPTFTNMIRAGEVSGQMEMVLVELTRQLKKNHELKNKVRGALMYPAAILVAMVGIGIAMVVFIIPKLLAIFKEMDVALPLPTRILIAFTDAVNGNILIAAPLGAAVIGGLIYFGRRGRGQKLWHRLILILPVAGRIAKKINLAKISRTLSSLLATDIPIVESLKHTAGVIKNVHYRSSLLATAQSVERGQTVSSEMAAYPKLYPPVVIQMTQVGEETGEIAAILGQLAEFYEEEVSQTMDSLPSLIEPVLIILLGAAVGGMAVAIILPMFSLSQAV